MSGTLLTVGELSVDDIVVEDEQAWWKVPGGGALYSAIGARLWHDDVAVCATVGTDYPQTVLDTLGEAGIDTSRVHRSAESRSLGLWVFYEPDGVRRQFGKLAGGSFDTLDALRPDLVWSADLAGVHCAPQSSRGQLRTMSTQPGGLGPSTTLDLLVEPYIDVEPYLSGAVFGGLDAFLPSRQEVDALWPGTSLRGLRETLTNLGMTGALVVKDGRNGAHVVDDGTVTTVPTAAVDIFDVTGAGDAFCGGFLAGLHATGDAVRAAAYGAVSSSFVVETRGALAALAHLDRTIADERLQKLMDIVESRHA